MARSRNLDVRNRSLGETVTAREFSMIKRISVASLAALGLLTGSAFAADGVGRYTGIGIGEVGVNIGDADFDEQDLGYKFFGGYMVTKNFGLELAYFDGATAERSGAAHLEVAPSGFTIEGIAKIPLGQAFAVFGKVGIGFYDAYVSGLVYSSESGSELIYGAGASVNLGRKFEIRAEWEQLAFNVRNTDGDFTMFTVGGIFKF
jgi:OOP family OmpA-OmpF porin